MEEVARDFFKGVVAGAAAVLAVTAVVVTVSVVYVYFVEDTENKPA
jgi:ABC-type dipeptide/oligopeptide/nickel transport system permease subunit